MTNTRIALISALALIVLISAAPLGAAQQLVTNQKDRERVAELATRIENDPLSKKARSDRKKVLTMLKSTPDLRVAPCRALLGEMLLSREMGARELHAQLEISTAKYLAEHPDATGDRERALAAGLEGVIRTYASMRSRFPAIDVEAMGPIMERHQRGDLVEYVREALADCDR